jgi:putative ABC transport system substrate-binding protein
MLGTSVDSIGKALVAGFVQGLNNLGYQDGRNVVFERRDSGGNSEMGSQFAMELVQLPVDVLVAFRSSNALAAQKGHNGDPSRFCAGH